MWVTPFDDHFRQGTWASRAVYLIWKQQTHVFDAMTTYGTQDLAFEGGAASNPGARRFGRHRLLGNHRCPARAGPPVAETEQQSIVISHELFERRFGARASVIGGSVIVSGFRSRWQACSQGSVGVTFPPQTGTSDDRRELDAFISLPRGHQAPGSPIPRTERRRRLGYLS